MAVCFSFSCFSCYFEGVHFLIFICNYLKQLKLNAWSCYLYIAFTRLVHFMNGLCQLLYCCQNITRTGLRSWYLLVFIP